ncbi:AbrB/MazE/SpoVT family DNA-binding domain-containing protein [bacterium]|nr:AbrB/MazE/SpoVT family DNA-binding domain-containing protein [bacterium]
MDTKVKTKCCDTQCEECHLTAFSLVSIDDRGQMVLPKEIRDKANIFPGDKLAVFGVQCGEEICCITMIKAGELEEMARDKLSPVLKQVCH